MNVKLLQGLAVLVLLGMVMWAGVSLYRRSMHPNKNVSAYREGGDQYLCSQPVPAYWARHTGSTPNGGGSAGYLPLNKAEAAKYCHTTGAY